MGNFGPTLEQRLNPSIARSQSLLDMVFQSLRVALPGVVQSFSPGPPATVSVLVATNEMVEQNVGGTVLSLKTRALQIPLLQDVPVVMPSAGGWSLTLPIQAGDECLLVFGDTPLDVWFEAGGVNHEPICNRRHSLSDAVAVFGLRSKPRALANYSSSSAQLRNDDGSVVIDLALDGITVTAPTVTVEAQTANVNGSEHVNVNGGAVAIAGSSVAIGSNTKIDNRVFLQHTHINAGGTTGPVV